MNNTKQTTSANELIFQAVLMRVLPTLSKEDIAQYEKMLNAGENGEKLLEFLKSKVSDFENIIKEEAEILRKELEK